MFSAEATGAPELRLTTAMEQKREPVPGGLDYDPESQQYTYLW